MSTFYSAAIVVGLPFTDFPASVPVLDLADRGDIERYAPFYDAPNEECLFGVLVDDSGGYSYSEVGLLDTVAAHRDFERITGVPGRAYLTPNVL